MFGLVRNVFAAVFGSGTIICGLLFISSFGLMLAYPLALILLGLVIGFLRKQWLRNGKEDASAKG